MVDSEASGAELAGLVKRLLRNGFELTGPKQASRARASTRLTIPRADLLRLRSVYAEKPIDTNDIGLITRGAAAPSSSSQPGTPTTSSQPVGEAIDPGVKCTASRRGAGDDTGCGRR